MFECIGNPIVQDHSYINMLLLKRVGENNNHVTFKDILKLDDCNISMAKNSKNKFSPSDIYLISAHATRVTTIED